MRFENSSEIIDNFYSYFLNKLKSNMLKYKKVEKKQLKIKKKFLLLFT